MVKSTGRKQISQYMAGQVRERAEVFGKEFTAKSLHVSERQLENWMAGKGYMTRTQRSMASMRPFMKDGDLDAAAVRLAQEAQRENTKLSDSELRAHVQRAVELGRKAQKTKTTNRRLVDELIALGLDPHAPETYSSEL